MNFRRCARGELLFGRSPSGRAFVNGASKLSPPFGLQSLTRKVAAMHEVELLAGMGHFFRDHHLIVDKRISKK